MLCFDVIYYSILDNQHICFTWESQNHDYKNGKILIDDSCHCGHWFNRLLFSSMNVVWLQSLSLVISAVRQICIWLRNRWAGNLCALNKVTIIVGIQEVGIYYTWRSECFTTTTIFPQHQAQEQWDLNSSAFHWKTCYHCPWPLRRWEDWRLHQVAFL